MAELKKKSAGKTEIPSSIFPEPKKSVYREWVDKKLKEHRLEEMLVAYADSVVAEITESFLRLKTVNKFHKMLTPSTIIDGVLLVDKDRKEELINIVGVLQNQYPTLNFMITGPWPPYNFIDINIK